MEKRRAKRKPVNLKVDIISNGKNYSGFIENMCESGLHMITASGKSETSFIPETTFDLKFQPPSGKKTKLHCEVRWVHINKTPIHGLTYRMGMEIIKHSQEYNKFIIDLK